MIKLGRAPFQCLYLISGIFEVNVYAIDFFRLSKIKRPSSTPVTMEAKLSSSKIMSAACKLKNGLEPNLKDIVRYFTTSKLN